MARGSIPRCARIFLSLHRLLSVTRATVSGLMAGLEHDGLVESAADSEDRRKLIARLTANGGIIVEVAFGVAMARFGKLFAAFSPRELATLTTLLNRVREAFIPR